MWCTCRCSTFRVSFRKAEPRETGETATEEARSTIVHRHPSSKVHHSHCCSPRYRNLIQLQSTVHVSWPLYVPSSARRDSSPKSQVIQPRRLIRHPTVPIRVHCPTQTQTIRLDVFSLSLSTLRVEGKDSLPIIPPIIPGIIPIPIIPGTIVRRHKTIQFQFLNLVPRARDLDTSNLHEWRGRGRSNTKDSLPIIPYPPIPIPIPPIPKPYPIPPIPRFI